jgi:hypothetical protein
MKINSLINIIFNKPKTINNFGIYQIFYQDSHLKHIEKDFIPFDNGYKKKPAYFNQFEFGVIRSLYESKEYLKYDLTGTLSWKFRNKTRLDSKTIMEWINNNPGYDVYFINPYPENNFLFYNVWSQGQYFHPKIITIAEELFLIAGFKVDLLSWQRNFQTGAYCNYWVGNKYFWEKYYDFSMRIFNSIEKTREEIKQLLFQETADNIILAPYFPFIFERLFSTLLEYDKSINYLSFPLWSVFPEKIHRNKLLYHFIRNIYPRIDTYDISVINSTAHLYHDIRLEKLKTYDEYPIKKVISKSEFDLLVCNYYKKDEYFKNLKYM